ncbi:MAG TPA: YwiC-like family protein [Opitutaceae bacterium]|nr:YwiC-like family protein [Opitutaceae bacterium]
MNSSPKAPGWREAIELILPKEHGGWSLALEPLVLGLGAAPSAAGGALAGAVLAGFFLRRPLRLWLGGGADPRRPRARRCVLLLAAVAAGGVAGAAALAGPARLWPLLLVVPPGAAFAWFDARGAAREAAAEFAGAMAFALIPLALASLAGWPAAAALALAAVMAARSLPTVLTLRTYLRRGKGAAVSSVPALALAAAAVAGVAVLARAQLAPWAADAAMAILLMRTGILLGPARPRFRATTVGIAESVLGAILVIVLAFSWFA